VSAKPNAEGQIISLVEFARQQRLDEARAACPVCRLPQGVREELRREAERGMKRKYQLMWLSRFHHADITDAELTTHRNGRHDG